MALETENEEDLTAYYKCHHCGGRHLMEDNPPDEGGNIVCPETNLVIFTDKLLKQ